MTAFMEAAGYVPAAVSAMHALGAAVRLWRHRRSGKPGPCQCTHPAERDDTGAPADPTPTTPAATAPGPAVVVAITPPADRVAAATITVTVDLAVRERGRW